MTKTYVSFFSILIKWLFWGSLVGVFVGTTTSFLLHTNDLLGKTREANSWLILLLPLGGVVIGYLYHNYGKKSSEGNNLLYEGVQGKAQMLLRTGPLVYIGTFLTVLLGGSTGREGAALQMGGSIAEGLNRLFQISKIDQKIVLMSGISGGFGAAFGTPITGAVFGMEVVALGKMKYEGIVPCFTASLVGHLSTKIWGVKHEHFIIEKVPELTAGTAFKIIVVAILFGLISVAYCQLRHMIQRTSTTYIGNPMVIGFIGGIAIVILTFIIGSKDYLGRGIETISASFTGDVPMFAFLAKLIFTAITMGTGFVGGEAIPLFFMGATLGNTLSPIMDLPISFLAALGLVAVFCGGANTPIASIFLGIEMFDGKGMEYFLMVCLISYLTSGHHGLWPSQQIFKPKSRLFSLPVGQSISTVEKNKKK
ncbi:chloride channel protein [Halalkalibacter urbisdiaboli]|uniref:chloride channel protein n=1 Tax=Halalkalibacter urbisdiaboli TaxID=1960589 RepID=UPI000B43D405|nr:chloride channel protein [Halalkalibacter urbisdiaboli]